MTHNIANKTEACLPGEIVRPGIEDHLVFTSRMGMLYHGDLLDMLPFIRSESVNTVFTDPPFNLSKMYGKRVNDSRSDAEYISWCKEWLDQCVRVLKPGGAIFIYNLPKWNNL